VKLEERPEEPEQVEKKDDDNNEKFIDIFNKYYR
jgi:hypothetical protein